MKLINSIRCGIVHVINEWGVLLMRAGHDSLPLKSCCLPVPELRDSLSSAVEGTEGLY